MPWLLEDWLSFLLLTLLLMMLPFVVFSGRKEGLHPSRPLSMFCFLFPDYAPYFPVLLGAKGEGDWDWWQHECLLGEWRQNEELTCKQYLDSSKTWSMEKYSKMFCFIKNHVGFFLFLYFLFSEMYFWWIVYFINFKWFPLSAHTDIPPLSCCRAFDTQFQIFRLILFLKWELCSTYFYPCNRLHTIFFVISCSAWTLSDYL